MSTSVALRGRPDRRSSADCLLRALGDRTRLRTVNLLARGELCVCDLVELLGLPQPTVSRHLAILRTSGIVRARRRGRYAHYFLSEPTSLFHAALLDAVRNHLDGPSDTTERSRAVERVAERRRSPCRFPAIGDAPR